MTLMPKKPRRRLRSSWKARLRRERRRKNIRLKRQLIASPADTKIAPMHNTVGLVGTRYKFN
jgi:hypothetical protein